MGVDYARLIDAETWAFIRQTESWYPPETASYPVERQREIYDKMARAFHQGRPEGLSVRDLPLGGVPCRDYGDGPVRVIYCHGGSFSLGGLDSHDDICAEIAQNCGYRLISVDFRLAPEHPHPAALLDVISVTRAVAARDKAPIVLVGDSAGGNLAATALLALRGEALGIAGQVLIYPGLGGNPDRGSFVQMAEAPMLSRQAVLDYLSVRFEGGVAPARDETIAPLLARDFSGLPPTWIVSAECDPLRDDGRDYRDAILAAGGKAYWRLEPGLVHGYLRARTTVARAKASFERICEAVSVLGRGEWIW